MNNTNNLNSTISIGNPNDKLTYNRYLSEIGKLKPLSREEEIETFKLVELGDKRAIDKVCVHNLLFVVSVAKRYSALIGPSTLTLEDLICEGNIGLIEAINRFDYREGNKFISYAVWWIKQGILTSIQRHVKTIRLPANIIGDIRKISKQEEILSQKLGRTVSTVEVFESMLAENEEFDNDKLTKINNMIKMSRYEKSIDDTAGYQDDSTLQINQTILCNDDRADAVLIAKERKELTLEMLSKLPPRAQEFIKDYYGIDREQLNFKAIGEKFDVTAETVRQSVKKNLRRLKGNNREKGTFFFGANSSYGLRREFKDYDVNTTYLI
jgi:RNA polymerase primary sigma factor